MKKVFAFAAVAAMISLASCSGAADAAKKLADSIAKADSMMKETVKADSIRNADSVANATKAAAEAATADSIRKADSIANAGKKK
jgi:predicted DNA-binding transcriptional regulator YafY